MREQFENLKVGDFVTVLNGKKYDIETGSHFSENGVQVLQKAREDGSYKGDVLEIMAMQYPYVVLKNHNGCLGEKHRISLDLREWGLMKISEEYRKAFMIK